MQKMRSHDYHHAEDAEDNAIASHFMQAMRFGGLQGLIEAAAVGPENFPNFPGPQRQFEA